MSRRRSVSIWVLDAITPDVSGEGATAGAQATDPPVPTFSSDIYADEDEVEDDPFSASFAANGDKGSSLALRSEGDLLGEGRDDEGSASRRRKPKALKLYYDDSEEEEEGDAGGEGGSWGAGFESLDEEEGGRIPKGYMFPRYALL